MGNDLKSLRDQRNLCDYDLHRGVAQAFAVAQGRQAEDIIRVLDAARNEPTRTQITDHVWRYDMDALSNVVDIYIHYLRDKIDRGASKSLIKTVRGVGYKIEA